MIVHLATERGAKAVTKHLWYRPGLNSRVKAVRYDSLLSTSEWPRGVYLFTDSERMTRVQRQYASWLYERLAEDPRAFVLLNHPVRHAARFDLLRRLHVAGINDFNVHRAFRLDDARFPIFLRYEDRHIGASTPLLHSRAEAEDWLMRMAAAGEELDRIIAVEFVDSADSHGDYRKYGAFRIGSQVVPRHLFTSAHWEVKIDTNRGSAFRRREEYGYLHENPHATQVMEAFEVAGLKYGRIDYAFRRGRIQVWEINDNPQITSSLARYWKGRLGRCLLSLRMLDRAFAQIESQIEPGPPATIDVKRFSALEALCSH